MFGSSKRGRAPVKPLTKETANPNAATAAASAFMRREPSTSLSSAAAAAALKARPMTPTNVADAQSKRSMRRSGSVSSTGSRGRSQSRSTDLRRSPSAGSMTERTFRSPSPGRSAAPQPVDVPPVPRLPKTVQRPASSHHPAGLTIQTQPFRTASQKAKDGSSQGSWFGAASRGVNVSARNSQQVLEYTPDYDDDTRSGSVSPSINFSYPRSHMESPSPSPTGAQMVYDANSRRMVPKADLLFRSQSVRAAAEKPVKSKTTGVSRSGSHLVKGTVSRTRGTAVEAPSRDTTSPDSTPPAQRHSAAVQPQDEAPLVPAPSQPTGPSLSRKETLVENEAQKYTLPATVQETSQRAVAAQPLQESRHDPDGLARDTELENTAIDAVPVRSHRSQAAPQPAPTEAQPQLGDGTEVVNVDEPADARPEKSTGDPKGDSVRRARMHSESPARSPARSAHFAPTAKQLLVRHEPPPRSLSPRKSALKNSSYARGTSPSDDESEPSEAVHGGDSKDEISRKKSFRVSFSDESNVIVGQSAEPSEVDAPVTPSPQQASKKTWHKILNRHKKEASKIDEDETMGPRPALPLFGSIREKKTKETDTNERPLVRPGERAFSPSPVSSPLPQASPDLRAETAGASNDSAIGSVLASESPSRNEANISRAREPLPPVVTSVDGTGYDSSSFMDTDDDEVDHTNARDTTEVSQQPPETVIVANQKGLEQASQLDEVPMSVVSGSAVDAKPDEHTNGHAVRDESEDAKHDNEVPSISVSGPSPAARESGEVSPEAEYFDVPGGFPDDDVEVNTAPQSAPVVSREEPEATPQLAAATESPASFTAISHSIEPAPSTPTRSNVVMNDIIEEEESADGSSIYSDAYEDISDTENGGFMSLDAVLTAPADSKVSKLYQKTKRKSQEGTRPAAPGLEKGDNEQEPLATQDDWENAKAYWRSLSVDKRRQLEKEALEEAGEDADQEVASQPKKNKKRRSTDRPLSTSSTASSNHADRVYQIMPGTSWAHEDASKRVATNAAPALAEAPAEPKLKKSIPGERGSSVDATHNTQANGSMRKTLRSNGGAPAATRESAHTRASSGRPASYHPDLSSEVARNTLANRRPHSTDSRPSSSAGPSANVIAPTLRRRGSDSSESSFRRSRPVSQGFGFRSSMRSAPEPVESHEPTRGNSRFSLRSLSPTGSTFGRRSFNPPPAQAPTGGGRMRTSMRTANSQPKQSKTKLSPFGKKSKSDSRFAESSDEEESGVVGPFTSRQTRDYSSDEEDTARPPPPRGLSFKSMRSGNGTKPAAAASSGFATMPARVHPGLPDSEDEIVQPKRNTTTGPVNGRPTGTLQRNRSGRGTFPTPAGPDFVATDGLGQRPAHQRRGSFMSNILRRKKDSSSMITRDVGESAARRDTRLERSQEELNIIRRDSSRLRKREPSWPLPDGNDTSVPERPATSAGLASGGHRMGFMKKRSVSHQGIPGSAATAGAGVGLPSAATGSSLVSEATTTAFPEEGKKKKFGRLRKMFGLND